MTTQAYFPNNCSKSRLERAILLQLAVVIFKVHLCSDFLFQLPVTLRPQRQKHRKLGERIVNPNSRKEAAIRNALVSWGGCGILVSKPISGSCTLRWTRPPVVENSPETVFPHGSGCSACCCSWSGGLFCPVLLGGCPRFCGREDTHTCVLRVSRSCCRGQASSRHFWVVQSLELGDLS